MLRPRSFCAYSSLDAMLELYEGQNGNFFRSESNRELFRGLLLSNATSIILKREGGGNGGREKLLSAGGFAAAIMSIENYGSIAQNRDKEEIMKERDVMLGCEKSLCNFLAKRIPCSCLDSKIRELKSKPSTGLCGHCFERKQRNALMVCTACNREQYCSRKCQIADWPRHKESCKFIQRHSGE